MVKVKVANPGPATLMVLNPRRKSMATRKRRSTRRTARRKATTVTANPPRRRRRHAAVRHRAHNPALHRRRRSGARRRRNPAHSGMVAKGLALAAGAALVQFTLGFVPPIGGVSPLADAARTAAVGWGLGTVMHRTGFGKGYADDVTLAGFTLAGGKLISSFILPFANRLFSPAVPPPPPSNPTPAQMAGIAPIYRGMQPYGAYGRGLNGIAVIDPALQPYGEYAG